uniref:Uncharacterized protein n=1 Tax=Grammatophora oceanica TaxID=210454 RepID=A0A7S1VIN0_9STRA|mmetsp:Transcript_45979/g.68429  ORF Transcript_45979/g.68429 Transcript_45979/m.68429 type:complete len:189 (+) Transcript_45979:230-796(+)
MCSLLLYGGVKTERGWKRSPPNNLRNTRSLLCRRSASKTKNPSNLVCWMEWENGWLKIDSVIASLLPVGKYRVRNLLGPLWSLHQRTMLGLDSTVLNVAAVTTIKVWLTPQHCKSYTSQCTITSLLYNKKEQRLYRHGSHDNQVGQAQIICTIVRQALPHQYLTNSSFDHHARPDNNNESTRLKITTG